MSAQQRHRFVDSQFASAATPRADTRTWLEQLEAWQVIALGLAGLAAAVLLILAARWAWRKYKRLT